MGLIMGIGVTKDGNIHILDKDEETVLSMPPGSALLLARGLVAAATSVLTPEEFLDVLKASDLKPVIPGSEESH